MILLRHDIASVMRRKGKLYLIIDIGPIGMMILFFCYDGHLRHKTKCLAKIIKCKCCFEAVIGFFPILHGFHFKCEQYDDLRYFVMYKTSSEIKRIPPKTWC